MRRRPKKTPAWAIVLAVVMLALWAMLVCGPWGGM